MFRLAQFLALLWCVCSGPVSLAQASNVVDGSKLMIVAFFPTVTPATLSDTESNDKLSDFQFYAARMYHKLQGTEIDFRTVYGREFEVREGKKLVSIHPEQEVGYYFMAKGKEPRVEYGVKTDAELMEIAREYFGKVLK